MHSKLQCVHRWGVSGTPLSKSIQDLEGPLRFLQQNSVVDSIGLAHLAALNVGKVCCVTMQS